MAKVVVREARFETDELSKILEICRESFPKYQAVNVEEFGAFLHSVWMDNPARKSHQPLGWVLEDATGRIGGFIGSIPTKIKIESAEVPAEAGHSWAVLPTFRPYSINLFRQFMSRGDRAFLLITAAGGTVNAIGNRLKTGIERIPIPQFDRQFLWLPKPEALVPWTLQRKGYEHLAKIAQTPPLAQVMTGIARLGLARHRGLRFQCPTLRVEEVKRFDEAFDELWQSCKAGYGVTIVRDRAALNWRHFNIMNLIGKTTVLACREGAKVLGYVAIQERYERAGFPSGHVAVTDLFYDRKSVTVACNLLNAAFEWASERGCTVFQVPHMGRDLADLLHTQRPYVRAMETYPYWYKAPSEELAALCRQETWWPTGSDGEANI